MWQSAAWAGALSLGGSVPTEFGTCWALLFLAWMVEVVAAIAAIEAPLIKVRRAIIVSPGFILIKMRLHHLAGREVGAMSVVGTSWICRPAKRMYALGSMRCFEEIEP